MRQAVLGLGMFFVLGWLAGCGATDPATVATGDILGQMNEAKVKMEDVTAELKKVADKAKDAKTIEKKDLADAVKAMDGLRKSGAAMHEKKDKADQLKDKFTSVQKEQLRNQYADDVKSRMKALDASYVALKTEADRVRNLAKNQETIDYLNDELRTAVQEFESVSRQK